MPESRSASNTEDRRSAPRTNGGDRFTVQTADVIFTAPRLVVATGGLSIAKIGATSFGYDLARQFGLKIETRASGSGSLSSSAIATANAGAIWLEFPSRSSLRDRPHYETNLSRKHAFHSPRPQRAGDSADLFLLGWQSNPIHLDLAPGPQSSPPNYESRSHRDRRVGKRCCGNSCRAASPIAGLKLIP